MNAILFTILVTQATLILADDTGCQPPQNVQSGNHTQMSFTTAKAILVDYQTSRSGFLQFEFTNNSRGKEQIGKVTLMKLDDEMVIKATESPEGMVLAPAYSCFCTSGETKLQLTIDPNPNAPVVAITFEDYEHTFPLRTEKFNGADNVNVTNFGEKEVRLSICSKGSSKPLKEGNDSCPACRKRISIALLSCLLLLFILAVLVVVTMCIKQRRHRSGGKACGQKDLKSGLASQQESWLSRKKVVFANKQRPANDKPASAVALKLSRLQSQRYISPPNASVSKAKDNAVESQASGVTQLQKPGAFKMPTPAPSKSQDHASLKLGLHLKPVVCFNKRLNCPKEEEEEDGDYEVVD